LKPNVIALNDMAESLQHRWKSIKMEPNVIYTTLGSLRECSQTMVMGPDTVRFLIETMEFHPDLVIAMSGNGIKFFAEDA